MLLLPPPGDPRVLLLQAKSLQGSLVQRLKGIRRVAAGADTATAAATPAAAAAAAATVVAAAAIAAATTVVVVAAAAAAARLESPSDQIQGRRSGLFPPLSRFRVIQVNDRLCSLVQLEHCAADLRDEVDDAVEGGHGTLGNLRGGLWVATVIGGQVMQLRFQDRRNG